MQPDLAQQLDQMQSLPMFSGITRDDLAVALAQMSWISVQAGTPVVREGMESGEIFLVVSGQLEVTVGETGRRVVVGQVHRGDLVGETAIYHSKVYRSASCVARTPCQLVRFDTTVLDALAGQLNPVPQRIEVRILRALPERIRSTLRMIDEVRRTAASAEEPPPTSSSVIERVKGLIGLS